MEKNRKRLRWKTTDSPWQTVFRWQVHVPDTKETWESQHLLTTAVLSVFPAKATTAMTPTIPALCRECSYEDNQWQGPSFTRDVCYYPKNVSVGIACRPLTAPALVHGYDTYIQRQAEISTYTSTCSQRTQRVAHHARVSLPRDYLGVLRSETATDLHLGQ